MALETRELYEAGPTHFDQLRLQPDEGGIMPKTFAEVAGGAVYAHGTPVAQDTTTGLWVAFTQGGSNGTNSISGFVFEPIEGLTVNDTGDGEVIANVLLAGRVHRDDVNTTAIRATLPAATSEAQLDTALKSVVLRERNIVVEGLPGVG
jgi:hypothetical protein